jgi:hypothetical protein
MFWMGLWGGGGFWFLSPPVRDYLLSFFSFSQGLVKECSSGGNCVVTVCAPPFPIHFAPVRDGVRCRPIFLPHFPHLPFVFHSHLIIYVCIRREVFMYTCIYTSTHACVHVLLLLYIVPPSSFFQTCGPNSSIPSQYVPPPLPLSPPPSLCEMGPPANGSGHERTDTVEDRVAYTGSA